MVVFDPQREWVEPERFASKGRNTPLVAAPSTARSATVYGGACTRWRRLERAGRRNLRSSLAELVTPWRPHCLRARPSAREVNEEK
jgi:hypothetical protein